MTQSRPKTLEMRPTGVEHEYAAVVPPSDVSRRFDFMYFIEVMDTVGNGAIYPDLETAQPYVIVRLERSNLEPAARRRPPSIRRKV